MRTVNAADACAGAIAEISNTGGTVALLLADDPTPLASGLTVFTLARRSFPDARRGLLVEWGAWADPEQARVVLRLMATGQIDYYVLRPWRTPDEYFHRTVTEFLQEWERAYDRTSREVTIIADPSLATGARAAEHVGEGGGSARLPGHGLAGGATSAGGAR